VWNFISEVTKRQRVCKAEQTNKMERHEKITQSVWNECKKASVLIVDSVELMAADTIRIFPFSPFKTQKMGFATLGNVVGGVVSRYLM